MAHGIASQLLRAPVRRAAQGCARDGLDSPGVQGAFAGAVGRRPLGRIHWTDRAWTAPENLARPRRVACHHIREGLLDHAHAAAAVGRRTLPGHAEGTLPALPLPGREHGTVPRSGPGVHATEIHRPHARGVLRTVDLWNRHSSPETLLEPARQSAEPQT